MSKRNVSWYCLILAVVAALVAGCGGGGGGTPSGPAPTVSGVAAAGAPLFGTVYLKDSLGTERTANLGSDGSFSFNLTGLTAPFILKAVGTAAGMPYTLYSFAPGPGVVNINPLSNLALAVARANDDLGGLYGQTGLTLTASLQAVKLAMSGAIATVKTALQPTLTKFGVGSGVNFIYDSFVANHQGLDLFFDLISLAASGGTVTLVDRTNANATLTPTLAGFIVGSFDLVPGNLAAGTVFVTPAISSVPAGGTLNFTALVVGVSNKNVTWSVEEGTAGGTVDTTGVYTAPATVGTYHVRATSVADSTKYATATVTVRATNLLTLVPGPTPGVFYLEGIDFTNVAGVDVTLSYDTTHFPFAATSKPTVSFLPGVVATNNLVAGSIHSAWINTEVVSGSSVRVATITFWNVVGTGPAPVITSYTVLQ